MQKMRLYIITDKYDIGKLKCQIINAFYSRAQAEKFFPSLAAIDHVYKNTCLNSDMKRLLADCYAFNIEISWFYESNSRRWFRENPDFAVDVLGFSSRLNVFSERYTSLESKNDVRDCCEDHIVDVLEGD